MGKSQREKGKRGEREWAQVCRDNGWSECRRTSQYCGQSGDASDVVGLPGIHQEVKRVERINIQDAMNQAIRDAKLDEMPIVAHRRNRQSSWFVTMEASTFFKLYKAWAETEEGN